MIPANKTLSPCRAKMERTPRCSGPEEIAANVLGKGDFGTFRSLATERKYILTLVPSTLVLWIQDPMSDLILGIRVLAEMSKQTFELLQ